MPEQLLQWHRECLERLVITHMTEPPNPTGDETPVEFQEKVAQRAAWDQMQTDLHSLSAALRDGIWPKPRSGYPDLAGLPNLPSRIMAAAVMAAQIYHGYQTNPAAPVIQGLSIFGPLSRDDNLEAVKEELEWSLNRLTELKEANLV